MKQKTSPDDFDETWPLKEPSEVKSDKKIRFPLLAQRQITGDDSGARVYWNYDPEDMFVFVSQTPARKSDYEFADWNDVENPQGENTYLRAPEELPDEVLDEFKVPGTHMIYLATPEMLTDDNPSAWVIPWTKVSRFLPEAGSPEKIGTAISRNPGFMSPSPF